MYGPYGKYAFPCGDFILSIFKKALELSRDFCYNLSMYDVFISYRREGGFAVDGYNFAVVAEVEAGAGEGGQPVKNFDFGTKLFKPFYLFFAYSESRAYSVVNNFYFRTVASGGVQGLRKSFKHRAAAYYKKFQINAFTRL